MLPGQRPEKGREVPQHIQLKAARQAERTQRLLNARERTLGIDKHALGEHCREHEKLKQQERELEQREAENVCQTIKQADDNEYETRVEQAKRDAELAQYWQRQRRVCPREWDLNDPKSLKKEAPPRTEDYVPPECGASSLQVFSAENRRIETPRRNREELIEENDRLMAKHTQERERERQLKQYEDEVLLENSRTAEEQERQLRTEACRRRVALKEEHKHQSRYKKHCEQRQKEQEDKESQEHVNRMCDAAFLVEDRTLGYRFDDPNRPRPDHFKGFSREEIEDIHRTQGQQMSEKGQLRDEDRRLKERTDKAQLEAIRQGDEMEFTMREQETRARLNNSEELRRQAKLDRKLKKKKATEEREYQEVFNNSILSKFGTSLV